MPSKITEKIRRLDDKAWFDLLTRNVSTPHINGVEFPLFPSVELQTKFVGSANEQALRDAFGFYLLVKDYAKQLGKPSKLESCFLDFGCGWGRFSRFFWKDVDESNLFGCDVDQMIVDTCHSLNVPGQIDLIDPRGALPYEKNSFDAVIAYSVFTHLPENIHLHWMHELARVARPGCVFCLTLEPRRFMDFISTIPLETESSWQKGLSNCKPLVDEFYQNFDAGNLVFMPPNPGPGVLYGDAAVPLAYIERHWSDYFRIIDYIDNLGKFWQAVLIVQRNNTA
jgi:SAM-dependent methyltransferase